MPKHVLTRVQLERLCLSAVRREIGTISSISLVSADSLEGAGRWRLETVAPVQSQHTYDTVLDVLLTFQTMFDMDFTR
jgi:hypothetical protein